MVIASVCDSYLEISLFFCALRPGPPLCVAILPSATFWYNRISGDLYFGP